MLCQVVLGAWYSGTQYSVPSTQDLSIQEPDAQESGPLGLVLRTLVLGAQYSGAQYLSPGNQDSCTWSPVLGTQYSGAGCSGVWYSEPGTQSLILGAWKPSWLPKKCALLQLPGFSLGSLEGFSQRGDFTCALKGEWAL